MQLYNQIENIACKKLHITVCINNKVYLFVNLTLYSKIFIWSIGGDAMDLIKEK